MKKEENQKIKKDLIKNELDSRSRSTSPKAYWGCHTCQMRNNATKKIKSNSELSDYSNIHNKNKLVNSSIQNKKALLERDLNIKKPKIKLTDLCDEDKKRIVELIEELSRFAEKNQKLKESLDRMQTTRQEQQDYILKQANLHLEEKTFYVNEINTYKTKIEAIEAEMKGKISQWEKHGRFMDNEIAYLAKALRKTLQEKNELSEQINHLKICLRQSLESFQRLRAEVSGLQRQEQMLDKYKSISCQTEVNEEDTKEKSSSEGGTEDEFLSLNQNSVPKKSSLGIINDKLEHAYQLLKRKGESLTRNTSKKLDIDLSIFLKSENVFKKTQTMENAQDTQGSTDESVKEESDDEFTESNYKFLRPFDQCSKTSIQAERILKKIGKPLNLALNECAQKFCNKKACDFGEKERQENCEVLTARIHQNNIVQKSNTFKSYEDSRFDEDRLLEELFYSDKSLNFGLKSILRLDRRENNLFE